MASIGTFSEPWCQKWQVWLKSPYLTQSEVKEFQSDIADSLVDDPKRPELKLPDMEKLIDVHGLEVARGFYKVWAVWCTVQQKAVRNDISIRDENLSKVLKREKINSVLTPPKEVPELKITASQFVDIGRRPKLEDRALILDVGDHHVLYAIFDGHGDFGQVAEHAVNYLKSSDENGFESKAHRLIDPFNFKQAIKALFQEIHQKAPSIAHRGGSTGTCVVVNRLTNTVRTAALGDSEAWILERVDSDTIRAMPLTYTLDWSDLKEATRGVAYASQREPETSGDELLAIAIQDQMQQRIQACIHEPNAKAIRMPYTFCGLNVSRAIGDKQYEDMISQSAKVVQRHLLSRGSKEAWLIVGSDGFFDAWKSDGKSTAIFEDNWSIQPDEMALKLGQYALACRQVNDNVSVIAVKIDKIR